MTTPSTARPPLPVFLALKNPQAKFEEFEKFHYEIQSSLEVVKIKLPGVSPLDSLAFKEYFLYSWYFPSNSSLFQTP